MKFRNQQKPRSGVPMPGVPPVLMLAALLLLSSCSTPRVETVTIQGVTNPPEELTDNPFDTPSRLPFEAPDFTVIRTADYLPAFEGGMAEHLREIEAILSSGEEPTIGNTLVALERSGELLRRVQRVFFNMTSAHTNDQLQELQAELAPRLSAHWDSILLNGRLYDRVRSLYERREQITDDPEELRLIEEWHRRFIRSGARLGEQDQQRIREINESLSRLTTDFQDKLMRMTRERSVLVEDRQLLEGLSRDRIDAASAAAREHGEPDGYLLTITNTTRQPILSRLENRELRERVWKASADRGIGENDGIDTRPLILEIISLRAEKAALMGYSDWAAFSLEPQTAGSTDRVLAMLGEMIPLVVANTGREAQQIREKMSLDGLGESIEPWDWEYYAEQVRQTSFDLDEEEIREYFELNRVIEGGVFHTMERLYGIRFEERNDLPVYHPDVRTFTVIDGDGQPLGLFYLDPFERDSKRGGAWMSSFVSQSQLLNQRPVVLNVLNIPKPADGDPALITFDQVTTLFHEMGHALHGLFSDVAFPSLSGTSVPRDFVEFPSTFHEDWAFHPDILENYALHYETGEPIPDPLMERIIRARHFGQGFDTQEYLAATIVDLAWHMLGPDEVPADPVAFEQQALQNAGLFDPAVPPRYRSPYFAHIFAGGYAASYYAYIWSEVLAADAFAFAGPDGLNREFGDRFREAILSRGGSREAMELYRSFRGGDPDVRHLLRRRGLEPE